MFTKAYEWRNCSLGKRSIGYEIRIQCNVPNSFSVNQHEFLFFRLNVLFQFNLKSNNPLLKGFPCVHHPPPLPLLPTEQPFERGASCSWTAATMWKPPNLSPDQKTGVWPPWAQHWTPTLPNTGQHWADVSAVLLPTTPYPIPVTWQPANQPTNQYCLD